MLNCYSLLDKRNIWNKLLKIHSCWRRADLNLRMQTANYNAYDICLCEINFTNQQWSSADVTSRSTDWTWKTATEQNVGLLETGRSEASSSCPAVYFWKVIFIFYQPRRAGKGKTKKTKLVLLSANNGNKVFRTCIHSLNGDFMHVFNSSSWPRHNFDNGLYNNPLTVNHLFIFIMSELLMKIKFSLTLLSRNYFRNKVCEPYVCEAIYRDIQSFCSAFFIVKFITIKRVYIYAW